MALFGRKKVSVGLDIGSGFVKAVEINHAGDQPEVTRLGLVPLPPDTLVNDQIMDPGLVAETLRELWRGSGFTTSEVVVAVGGADTIVKKIEMDRMPEADARQLLRWEAEQSLPFDVEEMVLDLVLLNPLGGGEKMDVLLVGAKRDLVDQRIELLKEAGLSPRLIELEPFALHNALEHNHPEAMSGITALVNVGTESSQVNILEEGNPTLVRDFPFGSRNVREGLQRSAGTSAAEAEALLVAGRPDPRLEDEVRLAADELSAGIQRAAAFLMTQYAGERLGRIFLSGGGSRIPGLQEEMARQLGVTVTLTNPFERLPLLPGAGASMSQDTLRSLFFLPVGLALRTP
jgi:type IV pilus assembly protein PilM